MKHSHTTRSKLQNSRVNDLQQIFKTLVNYNNIRSSNEKKIPFILSNFVYKKNKPLLPRKNSIKNANTLKSLTIDSHILVSE